MKFMTARDAKNHFGEFLDTSRREPVVVTKNNNFLAGRPSTRWSV